MKIIRKITKGLLLTTVAIFVFSINLSYSPNKTSSFEFRVSSFSGIEHQTELTSGYAVSQKLSDYFVIKVHAQTISCTTDADCTPPNVCSSNTCKNPGPVVVTATKEAPLLSDTIKSIAQKSQIIFKIFHPAIYFFTKHIGNFMNPDLVYGGKMGEMLKGIWIVSRNIVNIIFVLFLLYYAVMYIFNFGGESKTDVVKILPWFALTLIAVNFSWMASKLIVDAANVATNIAFAIPSGVKGVVTTPTDTKCKISADGTKLDNYNCSPSAIYIPFDSIREMNFSTADCTNGVNVGVADETGKINYSFAEVVDGFKEAYPSGADPKKSSPFYQTTVYCWGDMDIGKFNSTNAAFQLTYSMARVQNLPKAQTGDSISKLAIGTIFALFIEIVYLLAFAALMIALIFRVAMLWILVAFSPFIVLLMFMEHYGLGKGAEKVKTYLSMDAFIKWAFAPAKVAVVWAIGFIMITAGQTATTDIFNKYDISSSVSGKVFNVNSFFMGMNSLSEMIWLLMTIMIIWMGTFAVLSDLEGAKLITDQINTTGKRFFTAVASTPKIAPIIPTIDPVTNKLNWKDRRRLSDYDPATMWIEKFGAKYTEDRIPPQQLYNAQAKFKDPTLDVATLVRAKDKPGDAFAEYSRITGLNAEQIKKTLKEEGVRKMLELNPKLDKQTIEDLTKNIMKGASGGYPGTVPTPAAAKPAPTDAAALEKAFRNVIQTEKVKAEITGLDTDKLIAKAVKLKQDKPSMSDENAVLEAAKALKEEAKEAAKKAAIAGRPGAAPAPPPAAPRPAPGRPAAPSPGP